MTLTKEAFNDLSNTNEKHRAASFRGPNPYEDQEAVGQGWGQMDPQELKIVLTQVVGVVGDIGSSALLSQPLSCLQCLEPPRPLEPLKFPPNFP
jgi:hypothetical protein